jgi:hypothetical protein
MLTDLALSASPEEIKNFAGKVVVESESVLDLGIKAHAFTQDQVILVDETWTRICCPESDEDEVESIILWARDNPNDTTPAESKIVSLLLLFATVAHSACLVWSGGAWVSKIDTNYQ